MDSFSCTSSQAETYHQPGHENRDVSHETWTLVTESICAPTPTSGYSLCGDSLAPSPGPLEQVFPAPSQPRVRTPEPENSVDPGYAHSMPFSSLDVQNVTHDVRFTDSSLYSALKVVHQYLYRERIVQDVRGKSPALGLAPLDEYGSFISYINAGLSANIFNPNTLDYLFDFRPQYATFFKSLFHSSTFSGPESGYFPYYSLCRELGMDSMNADTSKLHNIILSIVKDLSPQLDQKPARLPVLWTLDTNAGLHYEQMPADQQWQIADSNEYLEGAKARVMFTLFSEPEQLLEVIEKMKNLISNAPPSEYFTDAHSILLKSVGIAIEAYVEAAQFVGQLKRDGRDIWFLDNNASDVPSMERIEEVIQPGVHLKFVRNLDEGYAQRLEAGMKQGAWDNKGQWISSIKDAWDDLSALSTALLRVEHPSQRRSEHRILRRAYEHWLTADKSIRVNEV